MPSSREVAVAQLPQHGHVALLAGLRRLGHERHVREQWVPDQLAELPETDQPGADGRVPVLTRPARVRGVVGVHQPHPAGDRAVERGEQARHGARRGQVVAGREQVAGVQADTRPRLAGSPGEAAQPSGLDAKTWITSAPMAAACARPRVARPPAASTCDPIGGPTAGQKPTSRVMVLPRGAWSTGLKSKTLLKKPNRCTLTWNPAFSISRVASCTDMPIGSGTGTS